MVNIFVGIIFNVTSFSPGSGPRHKVVEVAFGLVDGPIGEEVTLSKDGIAVASFDCERRAVVFLGVGDKIG